MDFATKEMSKRFKDLRVGDHIFVIDASPKNSCPHMTEVIVHNNPWYQTKDCVSFGAEYKKGYILDLSNIPADQCLFCDKNLSVLTNRERAVSYHKRMLKKLLDKSTKTITHEMIVSREILDEMRRAEKIRYEDT